ncbi:hypothetical protein CJD36_015840 [Flavipsychrobacter stenotrophus]|uniref:Uncharacterized protein n=1 Tax=Flavipsychrobacter stenotrophus TaxID=2077091 RepID=A0A2S7STT5_9BACT|nr:hypothetical protein CJD36_015840 [Flavipsychrobacter stenotrophus]
MQISASGGFFAFPAVFYGAFPVDATPGNGFSGFEKPPVSAVFRSFSTNFRQFSPLFSLKQLFKG